MAISVDPFTDVIYVPKADLTLIQASPEVRELDLNAFRLWLRDWEDEEDSITRPKTHNHSTEVALAGLTYARIIEILDPYTVEFEDGQYTINCTGANHNISDKKVPNQVSLIVNNAAGLITNAAIEYSSFNGGVTLDVNSPYSGTIFPVGTPQRPVNNINDAYLIAENRGIVSIFITGDLHITDAVPDLDGYVFIGGGMDRTIITIDSDANVNDCAYQHATVTGTLDGNSRLQYCMIDNLIYVKGIIDQCVLSAATITLGGAEEAHFLDCWSGVPGLQTPTINMGGSGQALALRNYNGGITLINKTGPEEVSIDLNSGQIILDATVTNGNIVCRGIGKLTDNSNGATVFANDLLNADNIANIVESSWDSEIANHNIPGTFGNELATKADIKASASTKFINTVSTSLVYGTVISGSDADIDVREGTYWQIQENATNGITVEFTFNIADTDRSGQFSVFGRYEGVPSTSHYINLWAYNYESVAWELLAEQFMPGGNTSDDEFMHEYYERNIDRSNNNEVKLRLIHSVATYNASHNLYLDYVVLSAIDVITAEDISDAVWSSSSGLQVLTDLSFIAGVEGGRWEIANGQMIFYLSDNVTEIARFNLTYDGDLNPIERTRV